MDSLFQKWGEEGANCLSPEGVPTLGCATVIFGNIVNLLLLLVGAVAVILIMVSGIKFITSGGDPKQVEGAKNTMTYAIIGLIIVLLSFFIINVISEITKVECIKNFGFTSCSPTNTAPAPAPKNTHGGV